ncbi:MAG: hypothetical protein KGI02_05560, partial [Thaumarchaeota archaeon]|nr:hypothetical protein [Nitrososphaerota archaeon]MDE1877386.1 hypothetical protein [Nitrososphaerota archaeon]
EIVAFKDYSAIRGISIHHAVNDISSKLGTSKTAYLDTGIFTNQQVNPLVAMLADSILDDLNGMRQDLQHLPIVVSGGGSCTMTIQKALEDLGNLVKLFSSQELSEMCKQVFIQNMGPSRKCSSRNS